MLSTLSPWIRFSISPAYEERYPGVAFGLTLMAEMCAGTRIDATYRKEGLTIAAQTMTRFGGGSIKGLEVFIKRVR